MLMKSSGLTRAEFAALADALAYLDIGGGVVIPDAVSTSSNSMLSFASDKVREAIASSAVGEVVPVSDFSNPCFKKPPNATTSAAPPPMDITRAVDLEGAVDGAASVVASESTFI
ncbi:hypothetical protein BELL_0243g00130 [Botrytis elliptica]|uniref:Uncharacterized protein n=1 Tax=Botrytis elliptica TaxID=278938 RepID=A0A4Z1K147_9HELO|nr:hypothetical protein BELL_0243g00130 [Botrytis elliptica]